MKYIALSFECNRAATPVKTYDYTKFFANILLKTKLQESLHCKHRHKFYQLIPTTQGRSSFGNPITVNRRRGTNTDTNHSSTPIQDSNPSSLPILTVSHKFADQFIRHNNIVRRRHQDKVIRKPPSSTTFRPTLIFSYHQVSSNKLLVSNSQKSGKTKFN